MIEEQAVVTSVIDGKVMISGYQKTACGGCAQKSSCGTSALGKLMGNRRVEIEADCDIPLEAGDQVVIGINESSMLWGAIKIYLVPLLVFMVFALTGEKVALYLDVRTTEVFALLLGVAGLTGYLFLLRKRFLKYGERNLRPIVIRKL